MFLQSVDMTDDDEQDGITPADTVPTGLALRSWFGVKLVGHIRIPQRLLISLTSSDLVHPQADYRTSRIQLSFADSITHTSCARIPR